MTEQDQPDIYQAQLQNRWKGLELSEEDMPAFLYTHYDRIQDIWSEETEKRQGGNLGFESYQAVSEKVGSFSLKVLDAAVTWARLEETDKTEDIKSQRAVGQTVLLHYALPSIIRGTNRAAHDFPGIALDKEDIITQAFSHILETIQEKDSIEDLKARFTQRINVYAYNHGLDAIADSLETSPNWLRNRKFPSIMHFINNTVQQTGTYPTAQQLADALGVKSDIAKRFLDRYKAQPALDSFDEKIIDADEGRSLLDSGLTPRQREILDKVFGFSAYPMSLKEIAQKEGVTYQAVHIALKIALEKLRRPAGTDKALEKPERKPQKAVL